MRSAYGTKCGVSLWILQQVILAERTDIIWFML